MTRNLVRASREILNRNVVTKVKHLLATIVVLFSMFGLITWQVRSLAEVSRDADARAAALGNHQTRLELYSSQIRQREVCVAGVVTSEALRVRFEGVLNVLDDFAATIDQGVSPEYDPLIARLHSAVDMERRRLRSQLPERDQTECPTQPPRPVLPDDLSLSDLEP